MAIGEATITYFTWDDWDALWEIRRTHLAEYGIDPQQVHTPPRPGSSDTNADVNSELERDLLHPDRIYLHGVGGFWIARDHDCPVGYVGAQPLGRAVELRRMYVVSAYRRRGIGSALVQALVDHCRAQGVYTVELWTERGDVGQQLYKSLGFRSVVGEGQEFMCAQAEDRYRPGPSEVRMRLDISRV